MILQTILLPEQRKILLQRQLDLNLLPSRVHRYMGFRKHTSKIFKDHAFQVHNPNTFNDPFDFNLDDSGEHTQDDLIAYLRSHGMPEEGIEAVVEEDQQNPGFILGIINKSKNETLRNCGVLCFSKNNSSLLMWAHYCDSHSGFVMTFDVAKDLTFFDFLLKVDYVKEYPKLCFIKNVSGVREEITSKSDHWIYEEEYRIVKEEAGLYSFDCSSLVEIRMGLRISASDEKQLRHWLTNPLYKHVVLKRAVKIKNRYGLEFENA